MSNTNYVQAKDVVQRNNATHTPDIYIGYVSQGFPISEPNDYYYVELSPANGHTIAVRFSRKEMLQLRENLTTMLVGYTPPDQDDEAMLVSVSVTTPSGLPVTLEGTINGETAEAN